MKCQACEEQATHHVTELVAGKPEEYHVCEKHLQDLKGLEPERARQPPPFLDDPEVRKALKDPVAAEKMSAYLLPVLCLALLDPNPEVRISSVFHLMGHGVFGKSAIQALRNALLDEDQRVRKAANVAIDWIETGQPRLFF
jgi:HEAT repeat protein